MASLLDTKIRQPIKSAWFDGVFIKPLTIDQTTDFQQKQMQQEMEQDTNAITAEEVMAIEDLNERQAALEELTAAGLSLMPYFFKLLDAALVGDDGTKFTELQSVEDMTKHFSMVETSLLAQEILHISSDPDSYLKGKLRGTGGVAKKKN